MRLLRSRFLIRSLTIFFLLLFVHSLCAPYYALALTSGPHQPEYTSYEEPGAMDMVNLLTGDFSFNLPILEVPGPEGSFSLPLTYNAGIGTDQQASWVGLGWNVNAGAITRMVNSFPDDAVGQDQTVTVQDLTGTRGWNARILGLGKFGWNNHVGKFGNLSLLSIINAEWTDSYTSVGIAGVNVTNKGVKVNAFQTWGALMTVASFGAAAAATSAGTSVAGAVAKEAGVQMAVSGIMDAAMNSGGSSIPAAPNGYWPYSKDVNKHHELRWVTGSVWLKEYKVWLDRSRLEKMYGSLYLGNAPTELYSHTDNNVSLGLKIDNNSETLYKYPTSSPTVNFGAASDINYEPAPNEDLKEYYQVNNPVFVAYDNFHVSAAGVSGNISPYRLDVGSVSMPREMSEHHDRLAPVKYLANDGSTGSYKVPFVYQGQISNSYLHHMGDDESVSTPSFYFGVNTVLDPVSGSNKKLSYILDDVVFKEQRIAANIPSSKKIAQGNYVEWLTNAELTSSLQHASGFMDFLSGGAGPTVSSSSDRYIFRTTQVGSTKSNTHSASYNYQAVPVEADKLTKILPNDYIDLAIKYYGSEEDYGSGIVEGLVEVYNVKVLSKTSASINLEYHGEFAGAAGKRSDIEIRIKTNEQGATNIGAFCITASDGKTYHFGFPINDYENRTEVRDINDPNNKRSIINRNGTFATTWLLTGITGPDFIDRNANGIIDDADWGHWIKLNYGIHMNDYAWQLPYEGYTAINSTHETQTKGKKQLVYLNSIETRSHVALFAKSLRSDGKSVDLAGNQFPLKLDEIMLMQKEGYQKLITPVPEGGYGMADLSNKTNVVFMSSSLSAEGLAFVKRNCLKRVLFTYDYTLCPSTLNSDASGKLTLKRLSILGRNDLKTVPDYKFEYANNPSYGKHKWDNWGMYLPTGAANSGSHHSSNSDTDASAWSLTKVTTPLGMELDVNYERDSYSSVSGFANHEVMSSINVGNSAPYAVPVNSIYVNNPSDYTVGESIHIEGGVNFTCGGVSDHRDFQNYFTVAAIGQDYIDVGVDYMGIGSCDEFQVVSLVGTISKKNVLSKGGNLRVASIITRNEFGAENKIRYLYKNDPVPGHPQGTSSGVISKEAGGPTTTRTYALHTYPDYPQTPVLYGKVTVLTGKLSNDDDYHTKQVYEFETPHYDQFVVSKNVIANNVLINTYIPDEAYTDHLSVFENKVEDKTSKMGRLKSIKTFEHNNITPVASMVLTYGDQITNDGVNNYQGFFSNSVLMFDRVSGATEGDKVHKLNRTTTLTYPYTLVKTVSVKDGFSVESENKNWDFLTGMVTETKSKSALGLTTKTVKKPAFRVAEYQELGSKALNPSNRNMLSQIAATYTYRIDGSGANIGLLSADVQTWTKGWENYRHFDGSEYIDHNEQLSVDHPVWRIHKSYAWAGDYARRQNDGSHGFSSLDEFNFNVSATNALWQYLGETVRFDHYGMPLESKDRDNIFTTVKMGYDNRTIIASASNAAYNEIAFSSAEDKISGQLFFGGEVGLGTGTQVQSPVHTGNTALSLAANQNGFIFKTHGLIPGKRYRASVWTNSPNGKIYYKQGTSPTEIIPSQTTSAAVAVPGMGNWYRIDLTVVNPSPSLSEIGVRATSGTVVFDDFRFQPADAVMTCFVESPLNFEFPSSPGYAPSYAYSLDNDNLFTKSETNEKGEVIKVYRESIKYGVKLLSESKTNFRRNTINQ